MNKIYRVLGRKGRITIPAEIREKAGIEYNDVLSFSVSEGLSQIVIRKEKICEETACGQESEKLRPVRFESLDQLTESELYDALVYLIVRWAEREACHENKNLPDGSNAESGAFEKQESRSKAGKSAGD